MERILPGEGPEGPVTRASQSPKGKIRETANPPVVRRRCDRYQLDSTVVGTDDRSRNQGSPLPKLMILLPWLRSWRSDAREGNSATPETRIVDPSPGPITTSTQVETESSLTQCET
ncbi:hypothetical protein EVAR_38917_1 [Eumeta japonica]|uniref:Uncharacterized protein n=1 Tax=Eumeta variegata TaxID=151549 RepID=A0A4C1ZMA1_EUMVA|nr:hypothetical protein EVAR_38917_1 [Eumeta japonica]